MQKQSDIKFESVCFYTITREIEGEDHDFRVGLPVHVEKVMG